MNHSDTLSSPGGFVPEPALPAPGSFSAWIAAARLKTLPAGAAPVMVGTAVAAAEGYFSALPALAALLGALWIQVGTNFANDLFDFLKGADTEERIGPVRVTQAGLLSQRQVTIGVIVSFAFASLCGVYLISVAGWPIVAIGIASILSGIAYTGGPWPLGYNGLGDLFVFVFFGIIAVTGTHFVQSGIWSPLALLAALPVGALSTAILVVNNTRDAKTDVKAGKRTLVVRLGVRFGRFEYAALVWASFAALFAIGHVTQNFGVFAALLAVPLAVKLTRWMYRIEPGPELNPLLGQTAQLLLVYSVLLSIGLLL